MNNKIHGAQDNAFWGQAIVFKSTDRSNIIGNWILHHQGTAIEIDQNCKYIDISQTQFYTNTAIQLGLDRWIQINGTYCGVSWLYGDGTPGSEIVLLGSTSSGCVVNNGTIVTKKITKFTFTRTKPC